MELQPIILAIWRRRLLLGIGLLLAVAACLLRGAAAQPPTAAASARVLLDTPTSQFALVDPEGAQTLTWRAELFARLASTAQVRAKIARGAGVPADRFTLIDPLLDTPASETTLPTAATQAAAIRPERYVLLVRSLENLPILSFEGRAPTRAAARRLVDAARTAVLPGNPLRYIRGVQPFSVKQLGPVRVRTIPGPSGRGPQLALGVGIFGLWFVGVFAGAAALSAWRSRGRPALA